MNDCIEKYTPWYSWLARHLVSWAVVSTVLLGLIMWCGAFNVLVRGASFKYEPADSNVNPDYAYYEPEVKKKH